MKSKYKNTHENERLLAKEKDKANNTTKSSKIRRLLKKQKKTRFYGQNKMQRKFTEIQANKNKMTSPNNRTFSRENMGLT